MELTLESLVRALRARSHRLADETETHPPVKREGTDAETRRVGERRIIHVGSD